MILHTGIDGGLHDVVGTNLLAALSWVLLGVNAAAYWTRQLIRHFKKGGK